MTASLPGVTQTLRPGLTATLPSGATLPPGVTSTLPPLETRRRMERMPRWYTPKREDPSKLPSERELERSLEEFEESQKAPPSKELPGATGVVRPLPRRALRAQEIAAPPLLMEANELFRASLMKTLSRFCLWLLGLWWFELAALWDKLRGRDSVERRAERLYRIIVRIGGTLIKLGQQLAMRVDLLPYPYCRELSRLLDSMPSFPLKDAVAAIERSTGKKMKEVFARFDPEPIGSASIACVYQAVLRTGEQVAVKVRRPGIGYVFAADLRALAWMIRLVEWLTIYRPGSIRNLIQELEISFMEELDLRREGYFQEIFRRSSQDKKQTPRFYFSAPRVFFEYSSREVLVQDFVSGIWLWEVLEAVEQGNEEALERMRQLRIDPRIVARRLLWVSQWSNLAHVLFHADPHPANIIVQADNKLIFIDFGACGYASTDKRNRFRELYRCQKLRDVTGMARAVTSLLEPLPPIDLEEFHKALERCYFRACAPTWSKQARWWERTSAQLWLNFLELTREFKLPIHSDTVKGLRATLLYDSLALRLDHDLDVLKRNQVFVRDWQNLRGRRMRKRMRRRMERGWQLADYATLDELARIGGDAVEQIRRFMDHPPFKFNYSIDKPIFAVITSVKITTFLIGALLSASASIAAYKLFQGKDVFFFSVAWDVLKSRAFQALICAALFIGLRRMMFRFQDRDIDTA